MTRKVKRSLINAWSCVIYMKIFERLYFYLLLLHKLTILFIILHVLSSFFIRCKQHLLTSNKSKRDVVKWIGRFLEITLSILLLSCFYFCMIYEMSGHFASLPDTRRRSRDRSSVTVQNRRSRRYRHGRTGLRRWSGTTSCSLPFRQSSTYPPITRTIRTRVRRWAIHTCPRPTRNTHIATCLALRRGRIICRPKRGKHARYIFRFAVPKDAPRYRRIVRFLRT